MNRWKHDPDSKKHNSKSAAKERQEQSVFTAELPVAQESMAPMLPGRVEKMRLTTGRSVKRNT